MLGLPDPCPIAFVFGQLRFPKACGQIRIDLKLVFALHLFRDATRIEHAFEFPDVISQVRICPRQRLPLTISACSHVVGISGTQFGRIRGPPGVVTLLAILAASCFDNGYVFCIMRSKQGMLGKFDLQALADYAFSTEGFVRTIFDPTHESCLLTQLCQGLVSLRAGQLICLSLGCKNTSILRRELLLLLHHGSWLCSAFLKIHLGDLTHCLFGTGPLRAAHPAIPFLSFARSSGLLRSHLQLSFELAIPEGEVDEMVHGQARGR